MSKTNKFRARKYMLRAVMLPNGQAKTIAGNGSWRDEYNAYLLSPQWERTRQKRLELDNYTCQDNGPNCLIHRDLQVHHKTYKNLKNESMVDLITLCRNCHNERHKPLFVSGSPN